MRTGRVGSTSLLRHCSAAGVAKWQLKSACKLPTPTRGLYIHLMGERRSRWLFAQTLQFEFALQMHRGNFGEFLTSAGMIRKAQSRGIVVSEQPVRRRGILAWSTSFSDKIPLFACILLCRCHSAYGGLHRSRMHVIVTFSLRRALLTSLVSFLSCCRSF